MLRSPLAVQGWNELQQSGRMHRDCLALLAIQAFVLLLWWPKSSLYFTLVGQHSPNTVMASSIALGISVSYLGIRLGAEELRAGNQHTLLEWVVLTDIPLQQALSGYFVSACLHVAYWILLCAPLMVVALSISPSSWSAAGTNLLGVTLLGLTHIFLGGLIYLLIGHHATLAYLVVRGLFLTMIIGTALVSPAASYLLLTFRQFSDTPQPDALGLVQPTLASSDGSVSMFLGIYLLLVAGLLVTIGRMLQRRRLQHRRPNTRTAND
jgi:hypothetical protein